MKISSLCEIRGVEFSLGNFKSDRIILSTDSRDLGECNVFLAIAGDNFDGFGYIDKILKSEIKTVIYNHTVERENQVTKWNIESGISFIGVKDSLLFLQDSARWWMHDWKTRGGKVLGLTGSNGKTTTKELIFELASTILKERVICTSGNLNNHIGVPLTILKVRNEHELAIIEMGTNHPGEIAFLCDIAQPDYGFITNIGAAHLEFFENEEGVFKEKTALYRYLNKNNGLFFVNEEDPYLKILINKESTLSFSSKNALFNGLENNYIKEDFNIWNLKSALFIINRIFPDDNEILTKSVPIIKLPENKRSQWITNDNNLIFLDAYNANPSSMIASIRSFVSNENIKLGESVFVVGDMNELGSSSEKFHREISELMNELKIKNALFIGNFAEIYKKYFIGRSSAFKNVNMAESEWKKVSNSYRCIFIKGSRSLQLESLLDITI